MDIRNFITSIIPAVALLGASIAGWIIKPPKLQAERPAEEITARPPSSAKKPESTVIRLWQDPFAGMPGYLAEYPSKAGIGVAGLKARLAEAGETPGAAPVAVSKSERGLPLVIAVLAYGEAESFQAETRRRQRHAVLYALGVAGYEPEDHRHVNFTSAAVGDGKADASGTAHFAYEWLHPVNSRRKDIRHSRVLVLWLREADFLPAPFARLNRLALALGRRPAEVPGQPASPDAFDLALVGPQTSTGLFAMVEEAAGASAGSPHVSTDGSAPWPGLHDTCIHSASATMTDELLPPMDENAPKRGRAYLDQVFSDQRNGMRFVNHIGDDGRRARDLVKELQLRGVNNDPDKKVLLVSEWDSDYGRALPLAFAAAWQELHKHGDLGPSIRALQAEPVKRWPGEQLLRVSFASGVDGQAPAAGAASGEKTADGKTPSLFGNSHHASGDSQFDYAERLAERLDWKFNQKNGEAGGARVAAVGIFGVDFYDKLALLRAIRPKFPEAVYFTTDLDARMSETDYRPAMKNLVVASAWPLENCSLPDGMEAPPWRSAYQNAAFVAVLDAVGFTTKITNDPGRMFEIGRSRAMPLSMNASSESAVPNPPFSLPPTPVLVLAGVCLFLVFGSIHAFRIDDGRGLPKPFFLTLCLAAGLAVLALGLRVFVPPEVLREEPFAWFENVSLWPAELVRVAAGLLGVYWILTTHREMLAADRLLCSDYLLDSAADSEPVLEAGRGASVSARKAWEDYRLALDISGPRRKPAWLRRYTWVWITSAFLVVCWSYFIFQPEAPRPPYRGEFSRWADAAVLVFATCVYTVLSVQIFDISRKTRRLVHRLSNDPTAWPQELVDHECRRLGLPAGSKHLDGWLDVRFLGELTTTVGDLVIRPFILLFFLLAAVCHDFFDSWHMNRPDTVILCLVNAILPVLCGWFLCREAEKARTEAARRLRYAISETSGEEARRYRQLLDDVTACRRGAFRPLLEQPYVIALLIPFAGSGTLDILTRLVAAP